MNYRNLLVASMFAALALPAVANGAPRGESGPGGFPVRAASTQETSDRVRTRKIKPLEKLQRVLRLTEAQVVAIRAQQAAHKENLKVLKASLREASERTAAAINQGASATDVGNAVLAANAIRQAIKAANEQFRVAFNNVLTTTQQDKLVRLRRAARQAEGLERFLALAQARGTN